jgi:hypothetical protein
MLLQFPVPPEVWRIRMFAELWNCNSETFWFFLIALQMSGLSLPLS